MGCAPLAPKELSHFFYWAWGVLNTYRPKGQTSWSKALVRHGVGAGGRCWECPRGTFGRGVP